MEVLQINDIEELDNYKWINESVKYSLKTKDDNDGYFVVEVYKNGEFHDMTVLSNYDNVSKDLSFTHKYGLNISVNEKYLKLKNDIKYIQFELEKKKNDYSENKEKKWVYERHQLYEMEIKEECLREVLSLLSILKIK